MKRIGYRKINGAYYSYDSTRFTKESANMTAHLIRKKVKAAKVLKLKSSVNTTYTVWVKE